MKTFKTAWLLLKTSAKEWSNDNVLTLSSSLSYFTIFSIAPLLIISIGIVGYVSGSQGSSNVIYGSIQGLLGPDGTNAIQSMVHAASQHPKTGLLASIIGVVTLFIGASSAFGQLQDSLNAIWKVKPTADASTKHLIFQRLMSFSMILAFAFLMLVSLLVTAGLSAVGNFMRQDLPGGTMIWHLLNIGISLAVVTGIFGAIFKIMPDVKLRWKDVWVGAFVTALFFTLGKLGIGLYLGQSGMASAYGAFGSLIVVLVWVYYSSAILFFGAEFTRVFTYHRGYKPVPATGAEWTTESYSPFGKGAARIATAPASENSRNDQAA